MFVTEDEAKRKWCPKVICSEENGNVFNRCQDTAYLGFEETRCISSNCMMWVWENENQPNKGFCGLINSLFIRDL